MSKYKYVIAFEWSKDFGMCIYSTFINECEAQEKLNEIKGADRYNSAEVMTIEEYCQKDRDFYLSKPLKEISCGEFNDMLGMLPPLKWERKDSNFETFCMSEMTSGYYTSQYARLGDKYFTKVVDCVDRSTWITKKMIEAMYETV